MYPFLGKPLYGSSFIDNGLGTQTAPTSTNTFPALVSGNKLIALGSSSPSIVSGTFGTAGNYSTFTGSSTVNLNSHPGTWLPTNTFVSLDGSKVYCPSYSGTTISIYQYTLTVPFDVDSGVTYNGLIATWTSGVAGQGLEYPQLSTDGKALIGSYNGFYGRLLLGTVNDVSTIGTIQQSSVSFNSGIASVRDHIMIAVDGIGYPITYTINQAYDATSITLINGAKGSAQLQGGIGYCCDTVTNLLYGYIGGGNGSVLKLAW